MHLNLLGRLQLSFLSMGAQLDHTEFQQGAGPIIMGTCRLGDSVAEWLACWTQAQKGPGLNRSRDAVG